MVSLEIKFLIKLTRVSKSSPKNNSNKEKSNEGEILEKGIYISELRHKITHDLRLRIENY